jgi:adenine deaminase
MIHAASVAFPTYSPINFYLRVSLMSKYAGIAAANIPQLLRQMPKAELHIHIEGSLEPEMIFALAQRNHVKLPFASVESLRAAYAFQNLQSFLDIYYAGASVLMTGDDFCDMALAYLRKAASENVRRAEIFFDPQTHTERGVDIGVVFAGLSRALHIAKDESGISADLILCFLRHLPEEDGMRTLEQALPYREHFIGVGLDSSERGHPPEKFSRLFARCRDLGLRIVAHAGEEGPPPYIETAIDDLQVERIDHGVRILENPELTKRVAQLGIPLTVCPLSNIKLCVFKTMQNHNIGQLLDAGLKAMINSDDPAYFGGYLLDNYLACFQALPLNADHAYVLAKNSLEAAFVPTAQKALWVAELDAVFATFQEN